MLRPNSFICKEVVDAVLENCPCLDALEFHHADLSRVPQSSLAKIGTLRLLNQLAFVRSEAAELDDRLMMGICGRGSLLQLQVTYCRSISDRLLRFVSRSCRRLWYADFTGCVEVTAKGLAYFCAQMAQRQPDLLYLAVRDTSVKGMELQRELHESSHRCDRWIFTGSIEIGMGARRACSLQNPDVPTKTLVILV